MLPHADQTLESWQYSFFDQAEGFLKHRPLHRRYRKRYSPSTKTDLNELGAILTEDGQENSHPGYVAKREPAAYWNLAGASYAYLYKELAKMEIDVVGESQLVAIRLSSQA